MTKSRKPRIFRSYSESQKKRIIDLYKEVNNARVVADELKIPYSSTASIIREYKVKEQIQAKNSEENVPDMVEKSIDDMWGAPLWDGSASAEFKPSFNTFGKFVEDLETAIKEGPGIEDVLTRLNSIESKLDTLLNKEKIHTVEPVPVFISGEQKRSFFDRFFDR